MAQQRKVSAKPGNLKLNCWNVRRGRLELTLLCPNVVMQSVRLHMHTLTLFVKDIKYLLLKVIYSTPIFLKNLQHFISTSLAYKIKEPVLVALVLT